MDGLSRSTQLYSGLGRLRGSPGGDRRAVRIPGGRTEPFPRLRLLGGARVGRSTGCLAARRLTRHSRELHDGLHGFEKRTAFSIALRVYRGGGLTKDVVYLRGLCQVLEYLKSGGDLELLFVGKIAA